MKPRGLSFEEVMDQYGNQLPLSELINGNRYRIVVDPFNNEPKEMACKLITVHKYSSANWVKASSYDIEVDGDNIIHSYHANNILFIEEIKHDDNLEEEPFDKVISPNISEGCVCLVRLPNFERVKLVTVGNVIGSCVGVHITSINEYEWYELSEIKILEELE